MATLLTPPINDSIILRGLQSINEPGFAESLSLERGKAINGDHIGIHRKALNCEDVKEGEGLDSVPNIAYWFHIPEDDVVRSEYEELNPNTKYVTMEIPKNNE